MLPRSCGLTHRSGGTLIRMERKADPAIALLLMGTFALLVFLAMTFII
jgi:hypothetical protein